MSCATGHNSFTIQYLLNIYIYCRLCIIIVWKKKDFWANFNGICASNEVDGRCEMFQNCVHENRMRIVPYLRAVRRWFLTAESAVQSCVVCGGASVTEAGFSSSFSHFLVVIIAPGSCVRGVRWAWSGIFLFRICLCTQIVYRPTCIFFVDFHLPRYINTCVVVAMVGIAV
jgi:hypothetical protein